MSNWEFMYWNPKVNETGKALNELVADGWHVLLRQGNDHILKRKSV